MDNMNEEHMNAPMYHEYTTVKTLLAWKAPGRPFRKKGREYYATSLLIMLFVIIIAFLFQQLMLIFLILSFVFVSFALASIPPHDFHYRFSTEGVTVEDHFFLWQELYDFYFKPVQGVETLHIRTDAIFPGELIIPLGDMNKEHVKQVLLNFLPYREVIKQTGMEKAGNWLSKTFPLEKQTKSTKVAP